MRSALHSLWLLLGINMAERLSTRAELIESIKSSSKDAVVLAEMQRLGYWPKGEQQPTPEAAVIERETELIKALSRVQSELHRAGNAEQAMKELRKERMQQALQKREATAQAREKRRFEQALLRKELRNELDIRLKAIKAVD